MNPAHRTRHLFHLARIYAGRFSAAVILYLQDPTGRPLESAEERIEGWACEFPHRFNPKITVQYDCSSEASEEGWQDDGRDEDAPSTSLEERQRQRWV